MCRIVLCSYQPTSTVLLGNINLQYIACVSVFLALIDFELTDEYFYET